MITIDIQYKNSKIEKICTKEKYMESFFGHDQLLIEGLKTLIVLLENEESIYNFKEKKYLIGYNLEKIVNSDKLSLRIVPKKDKRKERMIIMTISNDGSSICIQEINDHKYKV